MKPIKIFCMLALVVSCLTNDLIAQQPMKTSQQLDKAEVSSQKKNGMVIRISEIEIHSNHLEAYKAILKEEAEASVRLEPGVISIFPMYQKKDATQVRILEIYGSRQDYESHLKTPHFQKYKTSTFHMVKSLQLVDMDALDPETMNKIFGKLKE